MDIVNLAGIHKYNALTIFQRVFFITNIDTSKNRRGVKKIRGVSNHHLTATNQRQVKGKIKRQVVTEKKHTNIKRKASRQKQNHLKVRGRKEIQQIQKGYAQYRIANDQKMSSHHQNKSRWGHKSIFSFWRSDFIDPNIINSFFYYLNSLWFDHIQLC